MNIDLFMLDGSNPARAYETTRHVLTSSPTGFFRTAHFCSPTLLYKLIHEHQAPINYGDRRAYNKYVLFELPELIVSDHFMIIHRDGYPLNWDKWQNIFLHYDYIGAPWGPRDDQVGNGGFSIRSKRLALWLAEQSNLNTELNEDFVICVEMRQKILDAGFTFAPAAVAARFSLENEVLEFPRTLKDTFGFHGANNRLDLLL